MVPPVTRCVAGMYRDPDVIEIVSSSHYMWVVELFNVVLLPTVYSLVVSKQPSCN